MDTNRPLRAALAAVALVAAQAALAPAVRAEEDQAQQFTPEFANVHTNYDAKHTPKIVAPATVKRGQWFNVTISVGAGGTHPSLQEHFVRYIALYEDSVEIARAYLHPVYSAPTVTFTVALDRSGELRALEEPTHSAAWIATQKIEVKP
jgi:superoxide reductase